MKILLIGPPAAGKGTIGKIIGEKFDLPLINVGKLLREIPKDSIWYEPINSKMNSGELAPNFVVGSYLKEYIKEQNTSSRYEKGYILDGWIRQLADLEYFDPEPDIVLFLNISRQLSEERLLNRLVCEANGHTYNKKYNPSKLVGVCDIDGSPLIKRKDDNVEVLNKRWEVYEKLTKKVIEKYKQEGRLLEIDAGGSIDEVANLAISKISDCYNN